MVGVVGWGVYIPRWRVKASEIARVWGYHQKSPQEIGLEEKAVGGIDEDIVTMGWEASRSALKRAGIDKNEIGAVWVGTESKPYAVKPSAVIIAEALGLPKTKLSSDLEFACRAASEAVRISIGVVKSGLAKYTLVIGADTAQANPGNVLEFSASSAATALVIGSFNEAAVFEASVSYTSDTTDFWRREGSPYPLHGEAFTGEPAYFSHIVNAVKMLLEDTGLKPSDFKYAVFHQPNGKFPVSVAKMLGFTAEQVKPGLLTPIIGNSYNSSALIGFARVLEIAKPGDRIMLAPFGSGAGSDAYSVVVTDKVLEKRDLAPKVDDYLARKTYIDYALYSKFRGLITRIQE